MMKKTIFAITGCTILLSMSSLACSAEGPYVSGNLGIAMMNDSDTTDSTVPGIAADIESDPGLALGVAAGYSFPSNIRIEAEIAYQQNDLDKISVSGFDTALSGDTSSLALLLNGYYDFKNTSPFTPFITGGIGMAKVEVNDMNVSGYDSYGENDDDTVFAYQFGAGVSYAVNEKVNLDVKYRYFGTSDPEFDSVEAEYSNHNLYAGVRVAF